MKILWIFLTWAACAIGVQAQTASTTKQPATAIADGPEAERARINADRTRLEAGFAAEDTACYRKFLVNECLDEVKIKRREALADLRCRFVPEGFADRRYLPDGTLVPRSQPNAMIADPEEAVRQAEWLIRDKGVRSLCVHGDNPDAVAFVRNLRSELERRGFNVRAFA